VPLLQKLLGFAGCGSSSERRPTGHFARPKPETAKPSAVRSQRLCLRPPYVPFSWTVIVGMSQPGSEADEVSVTCVPFSAAGEDAPSPTEEE
jgi:hypothetical protein